MEYIYRQHPPMDPSEITDNAGNVCVKLRQLQAVLHSMDPEQTPTNDGLI